MNYAGDTPSKVQSYNVSNVSPNEENAPRTVPNRGDAERFLTLLDEEAEAFTFQTFDDRKGPKDTSLTRVLNGSLDEHWNALVDLNQRDAGIFVTVNETDLKGRKKENITRIRALWQEADRGDEPQLPVEPHFIVESSPGKHHRYILVEDAPLDEFDAVQQRLVDDYGSDPNAKDISRVLRLPGFDHLKNPDQPHRVRIVHESGELPTPWERIQKVLPPVERRTADVVAELPAPGTPLANPAEIASALAVLDPDIAYTDWVKVGMALHSTGAGREAFELWDTWSKKGSLYKPGESVHRWSTFNRDREQRVTIASLFHLAHTAGWDGQLSTDSTVLPLVDLQRCRMLEDFAARHAVTMINGRALVVYRELDQSADRMTTRFSSRGDIMTKYEPEKLPTVKKVEGVPVIQRKPLVPIWMQSRIRKTYDQIVFTPIAGLVAGSTALPDGKVLNLYQGLAIEPKPGDCPPMLDHIREVWCNGDPVAYDYVIQWLARMLQRPDERGHTVIVLRSGEGTGKNIIIDVLVRAFGEHVTVAVKPEDLTGRFNDHLGSSVLVFANEAVWGGDKTQEGALKSLITDVELPVERKYVPKYRVRNCTHLIMASNNDWVAPVGLDDRRFVILDVSESKKGDAEYFTHLADHIANGGDAAFIDYLLKLDISEFNPRVLPDLGINQATKRDAKIRGADSVTQWWAHCLDTGEILLTGGVNPFNLTRGWTSERAEIPKQTLHDAYADWARQHRKHVEHLMSFSRKLRSLADVTTARPRSTSDGQRPRVFVLPTLGECRRKFEAVTRQVWDWGEDDDQASEADVPATSSGAPEMPSQRPPAGEILAAARRAAEAELTTRSLQ